MWKMPIAREIPNKVIDTARVYFLVIVFPFLIGLSWCDIANYLFFYNTLLRIITEMTMSGSPIERMSSKFILAPFLYCCKRCLFLVPGNFAAAANYAFYSLGPLRGNCVKDKAIFIIWAASITFSGPPQNPHGRVAFTFEIIYCAKVWY